VRVGATGAALEVLTGSGDASRRLVRAVGRLLSDEGAETSIRTTTVFPRGPEPLTAEEWWTARFCEFRNAIVHGDEIPEEMWIHEEQSHLNWAHDFLIRALKAVVAQETGDELLRQRLGDRLFPRLAQEYRATLPVPADEGSDTEDLTDV
jgi:hypothetical protein